MTYSDIQILIGSLTNDPNHDRYSLTDIATELDAIQDRWNVSAKIIEDTFSIALTANVSTYLLSNLTGTPISFNRVVHKGIVVKKKSKAWLDLYVGGHNWTGDLGTPQYYYVDSRVSTQNIIVYPLPQSGDVDGNLMGSYTKRHTPMSAASDQPFNANTLLIPYHSGVAYEGAARLLLRDPSPQNNMNVYGPRGVWGTGGYSAIAAEELSKVVEVFRALDVEEPKRIIGGRTWDSGNVRLAK